MNVENMIHLDINDKQITLMGHGFHLHPKIIPTFCCPMMCSILPMKPNFCCVNKVVINSADVAYFIYKQLDTLL